MGTVAAKKQWKQDNAGKVRSYKAASKHRNREFIRLMKNRPCKDCGQTFHYSAMDFDHVRGEKVYDVARMTQESLELVLSEIDKCDVVCSNCHRYRTWQRRQPE